MFYNLSNLDIKMLYISNEFNPSKDWMNDFFVQIKFFAEHRVKKSNFFNKSEDLLQDAYLGLWNAIITYDYQKNFDFYRWAQWNISKMIRSNFRNSRRFYRAKSNTKNESYSYDMQSELEAKVILGQVIENKNNVLSYRERSVVEDLFVAGKTLKEVSKDLGVSIERIRQIKNHSLLKLNKLVS